MVLLGSIFLGARFAPAQAPPPIPLQPVVPGQLTATVPSLPVAPDPDDAFLREIIDHNVTPIDLPSALALAGDQNSQILLAESRVTEAVALRQLAAAQFLPTLNAGASENTHDGVLQRSSGIILRLNRESLYLGAGAFAVGTGTVNVPGVLWTMNLSQGIYGFLIASQTVDVRGFESQVVSQDMLLQTALAYVELVRAEEQRRVAAKNRDDAAEVARLAAAYLVTGAGRKADADRAAMELARYEATLVQVEGQIGIASARLCRLLHLDPSLRLQPVDDQVLPKSIVPEQIPLPDLLAVAMLNRPEFKQRRAEIVRALLALDRERHLPFCPTVYIGYSYGDFGGGSDIADQPPIDQSRFGNFGTRQDIDAIAYWTLLNLGVGNRALIDAARSRVRSANLDGVAVLDQIRADVAAAYAKTHARFAQIETTELAIESGAAGYREDTIRTMGREGRPIELENSLRLLAQSRSEYVDAILDYNRAQFELYVALGRPPADLLVRPADANGADPAANRWKPPFEDRPAVPPAPK
jgi:outer membrane protein TolC